MVGTMIPVKDWMVLLHPGTDLDTRIKQDQYSLARGSYSRKSRPRRALWRPVWTFFDRAPLELWKLRYSLERSGES